MNAVVKALMLIIIGTPGFVCCQQKQLTDQEIGQKVKENVYKFESTLDSTYLSEGFMYLNQSKTFRVDKKLDGFYEFGKKLLLLLEEYDLAIEVIGNSEEYPFTKDFDLTFIKYMREKKINPQESCRYAELLVSITETELKAQPANSNVFLLFLLSKTILYGKKQTEIEVDSLLQDPRFDYFEPDFLLGAVRKVPEAYICGPKL